MIKINLSFYNLSKLFASLLISWMSFPWFCQNTGLFFGFLLAFGWCVCAFFCSKKKFSVDVDTMCMILFVGYLFLSLYFFGRVFIEYEPYYFLSMASLFFLPYYMFIFYFSRKDVKFISNISILAMVLTIIGSLTSSYYAIEYPMIMKTISQGLDTEFVALRKAGIGSFGFIYMLMFCFIGLIGAIKSNFKNNNKWLIVFAVVFLSIGAYCISVATFSTAILLSILGALLVLIGKSTENSNNTFKYFAVFILMFFFSRGIGELLLKINTEYPSVNERMTEIGNILLGNEVGGNTFTRIDYFNRSLECFANYFAFGYNFQFAPEYSIGTHSEWVDIFGAYGIAGGMPLLSTIILKIRNIYWNLKKETNYRYYAVIVIIFVIYGFLDPFIRLYNIGFAIFFLVPGIAVLFQTYRKKV